MSVIAINQQLGSGGAELGQLTAAKLGYRCLLGEQLIAATAEQFGVSPDQMRIFDIHTPHFWERSKTEMPRYVAFFRSMLLKELARERTIVVGRSVAFMVPASRCVLRVRVVAPIGYRIAKVAVEEKMTPAAADKHTRDYDTEVKARIQSLYNLDIDDAANYDLVMRTANHPVDAMVEMLGAAALSLDAAADETARRQLCDASLAAQVHAALFAHPKIRDAQIEVGCKEGCVRISGPGLVPPWDQLVAEVARSVEGVVKIDVGADAAVIPDPPG